MAGSSSRWSSIDLKPEAGAQSTPPRIRGRPVSILSFWRSRALRRILIQGAYVAALVAIVVSA